MKPTHSIRERLSESQDREKYRTDSNRSENICLNCEYFRAVSGRCYFLDDRPTYAYFTNTCESFYRVDFEEIT